MHKREILKKKKKNVLTAEYDFMMLNAIKRFKNKLSTYIVIIKIVR